MIFRILTFFATVLACSAGAPAHAAEHITLRRDGELTHLTGRIVVEAQDGGVLLLAPDGVLWAVESDELVRREADDVPFRLLDREELTKSLLQQMPAGFEIHDTAHYLICYNTSRAYAQWCGALYERLYRAFHTYWKRQGIPLQDPAAPLVTLVFDSRSAYLPYSREELGEAAESIVGYYSLRTNRITSFDLTGVETVTRHGARVGTMTRINQILSQPAAQSTVATIVHEATHQLAFNCGLHQRYADIPLWVSEGIAVYFEAPDLRSSKGWRGIGKINQVRLAQFGRYLSKRPSDSLQTLVSDDRRFRDPELAPDAYAEAWALWYFLLRRHPKATARYVQKLAEKKPSVEDSPAERVQLLQESLGMSLQQLDTLFLRSAAR